MSELALQSDILSAIKKFQANNPRLEDCSMYSCGCINGPDMEWGVMRRIQTCAAHQAEGGKTGLQHYIDMGCIVEGVPQHYLHERQMTEALSELDIDLAPERLVLDVGCGLGMLAPMFLKKRMEYCGIERDAEAAKWVRSTFGVRVCIWDFEGDIPASYIRNEVGVPQVIVAAHVFEHLKDAPMMMRKAMDILPYGGHLILIVPNGEDDPVNPDHIWHFTPSTLRSTLERIGFTDIRMAEKQIVKHERFIYCSAVKL